MQSSLYRVISHLDNPKRYLALTMDELGLAIFVGFLLVMSSHKIVICIAGLALYAGLKALKQGHGPRHILVQMYWHLPPWVTQWVLPNSPASHLRVWRA
jgi:conjugal transfer pilus assembly protein TraL